MRYQEQTTMHRDNHYLPRHYLKRWANDLEQVWTYAVLVSHQNVPAWRLRSTKGLAYHAHLYTRVVAGGETDEIEKWLDAEFEAPAEKVLQKAVSNGRLFPEDWRCLARYVAAQDVRTPARLAEMMMRWQNTLPDLMRTTLEESVRELETAKREGRTPVARGHPYSGDAAIKNHNPLLRAKLLQDRKIIRV